MDATKREILGLYDEDFYKIDPTGKAASLFKAIPAQLAGNAHRYQITPVIGEVEDTAQLTLLHEMEESKTVNVAHHVDNPNHLSERYEYFADTAPPAVEIIAGRHPAFPGPQTRVSLQFVVSRE